MLALLAGGLIYAARVWPFTETQVRRALEDRFARGVRIASFHQTFWPPGCIARGVEFEHRKRKDLPPLITVEALKVIGSYAGLLHIHKRVPNVVIEGLRMSIAMEKSGPGAAGVIPLTNGSKDDSLSIDEIKTDGAVVEFRPSDPRHKPFVLEVAHLRLRHIADRGPVAYHAELINSVPQGRIDSDGIFGPWNEEDPAATPVSGAYSYRDVNLAQIKGLAGVLTARGEFHGNIGHMDSQGEIDIDKFRVGGGPHSVHLTSKFEAVVNGANGDTELREVRTAFRKTTVIAQGSVAGRGERGKTIALDLQVNSGRIEDLLSLVTDDSQPSMTGAIRVRAKVEVPPGPEDLVQRLTLTGSFGIGGGRFADVDVQKPIEKLAHTAAKKEHVPENPATVVSDLRGTVSVKGGIATLTHTSFRAPGSFAQIEGTYTLANEAMDLKGVLYTDGKLSATASGFKAVVMKALQPFLKKKSLTVVPFTIKGTSSQPRFALDVTGKRRLG